MRSVISSALLLPAGLALFFFLFILLARALSPEEYGKLSFILSLSSFIGVLLGAGLPIATTKFVPNYLSKNNYQQAGAYLFWGGLWVSIIIACLLVILLSLSYVSWNETFKNNLYYLALTIPPIMLWQWQRYSSLGFDFVATAIIPRDIAYPAICILGLYFFTVSTVIDALLLLNSIYLLCIFSGIFIFFKKKNKHIKLSKDNLSVCNIKEWHNTSFPMVLSIIVQLGLNNWDLILLGLLTTMEDTGKYAVATRIAMLISLVIRIFDTAISQKIAKLHSFARIDAMQSMFYKARLASLFAGLLGFIVLALFSNQIIALFGSEYKEIKGVLLILAAGQLATSLTGPVTSTLNMTGKEKFVAKSLLKWSLISLLLNLLLIPMLSVYGAAFAFLVSTAGLRFEQYTELNKYFSFAKLQVTKLHE